MSFPRPLSGRLFVLPLFPLVAAGLGVPVVACGPGGAGEAVRPQAPSAATAIQAETADAIITCRPGSYAEPLAVDLSANARADFEAAMDSGVAVVHYDCKSVRLLKDCRIAGEYRFAGVSRKEEVIHLDNRDEIKANLPLAPVAKGSAEMERASALDIAYVLVGKRSTPAIVSRQYLEGSQCGEATHYIRAATVGAFAVQTATKGRVAAAAEVFGSSTSGSSQSGKNSAKKDGNPKSCEESKPGSDAPPGECRSAIRFELVPVADKPPAPKAEAKVDPKAPAKPAAPSKEEGKAVDDPCPEGFKLIAGKCSNAVASAANAAPASHLCAPKDTADCETQCTAGNFGSCHNLANLAYRNYGKDVPDAQNVKDEDRALDLWKKACDGGVFAACNSYADNRTSRTGSQPKDLAAAHAAYTKACDGGNSDACYTLGDNTLRGREGETKDPAAGFTLLSRSCKLGDSLGCREMGEYLFAGKYGVPKNPALADKLLTAFCNQGDLRACDDLGHHLLGLFDDSDKPEAPLADIANAKIRGRGLLDKVCRANVGHSEGNCATLGRVLVADNDPKGRALLAERCPTAKGDTCVFLGRSYLEGKGGPVDKAKGYEALLASKDDDAMMKAALAIQAGDGVKKDAARAKTILEKLCKEEEYAKACKALGGAKPGAKPGLAPAPAKGPAKPAPAKPAPKK
ncbi:MAG: sel1 repeat family protein [Myxococcales bacterium]|nr:sel1 repeat family protein [Myxococcales bacterium]MBL0196479.1 sel1 repeat family protein [Myxococcales bacterium]HQY61970.1 hypothetical protein [Polyangiaceae bacterium]